MQMGIRSFLFLAKYSCSNFLQSKRDAKKMGLDVELIKFAWEGVFYNKYPMLGNMSVLGR